MKLIPVFLTILLGLFGQILLKQGMLGVGALAVPGSFEEMLKTAFKVGTNPFVIAGLFCYFLGAGLWVFVLSRFSLSQAYPLLGLQYVLVFAAGWLIFREQVTVPQVLGAVFISLGVVLIRP